MQEKHRVNPSIVNLPSKSRASSRGQSLKSGSASSLSIWLVVFLLSLVLGGSVYAQDLTLAWDPNTEPDLDGYTVYYAIGTPGPPYDYVGDLPLDELPDPNNPSVTLTDLDRDTNYYFALTAYDTNGNESSFSSSLCITIGETVRYCEPDSVQITPVSGASSGGSSGGGGCFITSSRGGPIANGMQEIGRLTIAALIIILLSIAARQRRLLLFPRVWIRRASNSRKP